MKKLMTFCFILLCISGAKALDTVSELSPPCIVGPQTIELGGQYLFYTTAVAQCGNCHDWDISGSASITNPSLDQNGSVTVTANSLGSFTLNLTYFTETGCKTCTRTFNVVPADPEPCLEPELSSKIYCDANPPGEPGGHGAVSITNWGDATAPIESFTYIFNSLDNNGNFSNFSFSETSTQTSITIYNLATVNFWFDPGTCPSSGNNITFQVIVTFDSKECETFNDDIDVTYQCGGCEPLAQEIEGIFPNPAEDGSRIRFDGMDTNRIKNIEVLDIYGNTKINTVPQDQSFHIKGLTNGIYFVKFYTIDGQTIQKRLIVE